MLYTTLLETNKKQKDFLLSIKVSSEQSRKYKADTITQTENPQWFNLRKHHLTSSISHKIYIRKKKFETLVQLINTHKNIEYPKFIQESLDHGHTYESHAREKYIEVLRSKLIHNISVRKTGIVIQPNLF